MKCPICGTAPHTPIQIKRVGMCRWCEKQVITNCDLCNAPALHKRLYQHPNGERYWMNICVLCAPKHADFEVK
jgi:hypothetical protein